MAINIALLYTQLMRMKNDLPKVLLSLISLYEL
jgi:hypothetical protein